MHFPPPHCATIVSASLEFFPTSLRVDAAPVELCGLPCNVTGGRCWLLAGGNAAQLTSVLWVLTHPCKTSWQFAKHRFPVDIVGYVNRKSYTKFAGRGNCREHTFAGRRGVQGPVCSAVVVCSRKSVKSSWLASTLSSASPAKTDVSFQLAVLKVSLNRRRELQNNL